MRRRSAFSTWASAFYMLAAINKVMLPVNTKDKVYVPFVAWKMNDGVGQCEMSRDGARERS